MDHNGYKILIHAILALCGGCVREIDAIGKKGLHVFSFISGAVVSTFGGIVLFFLCMNYGLSPWLTAALTSLAGYIGLPLLDIITNIFKNKIYFIAKR